MCLGVPVQVIECGQHFARCAGRHGEQRIDISLVGEQAPGVWLLCFLDAAREVIEPARADAILSALAALDAVQDGQTDFTAFFADLEREPQLPEFLRIAQP